MRIRLMDMNGNDLRALGFMLALGVYALFGLPTPDNPGIAEAAIALGLIVAVGFSGALRALKIDIHLPLWHAVGRILLIFGLVVPSLKGVLSGHDIGLIFRDVAPFLFLVLPVFLAELFYQNEKFFKYCLGGVLVLGVVFSLRALADQVDHVLSVFVNTGELTYFANAPSVLFTALFLIGFAAIKLTRELTFKNLSGVVLCFTGAVLVMIPIVLTSQRASLGYIGLYSAALITIGLWRYTQRTLMFLAAAALCLLPFYGVIGDVLAVMTQKTTLVGFNMRFEELNAVWVRISGGPLDVIFGTGWGGNFESPAVGEVRVNFTHSLLSSALLKTGLTGLLLVVLYIFGLAKILWRHLVSYPVLILALAGPFMIDVFLYASFKSLDFGLILLLIAGLGFSHQNLPQKQAEKLQ